MATVKYNRVGFNAEHVASLTLDQWLKEAKGEHFPGSPTEDADLKSVHEKCVALVTPTAAPESPKETKSKKEVPQRPPDNF